MLTVASWNVNSLRARLPLVLRYLDAQQVDALGLQETRIPDAAFPRQVFEERGYHVATASAGTYAGVAWITRLPLADIVIGIPGFDEPGAPGRRLGGRLGSLWIDTVYVPTRTAIGKAGFLDALGADYRARITAATPLVLAGDFNICFDRRDFASPSMITDVEHHTRRPEDMAWRRLLEVGLVDCFRQRCADGGHYSWFPNAAWAVERNYGMRLDYVFATAAIAAAAIAVTHDREPHT